MRSEYYTIVYNRCCFYWAVLDDHGAEVAGFTTKQQAIDWVHSH